MRKPLAALDVVVIRIDHARTGHLRHREQPLQGKLPELNSGVVDDQEGVGGLALPRDHLHGAAAVKGIHHQPVTAFGDRAGAAGSEQVDGLDQRRLFQLVNRSAGVFLAAIGKKDRDRL